MKALRVVAGIALVFGLVACGSSNEPAAAPTVMPDVVGKQLDVALSDIEGAGFTDDVDVEGGGTFGVIDESNWQVCEQSPAAGQPVTAAPKVTVDRSCGGSEKEETTTTEEAPEPEESSTTSTTVSEEVLATDNNPDLAALLVGSDCDDAVATFASTYRGRTIEFDGNIANLVNHGDYSTRFDILVLAGDAGSTQGPSFTFEDVGMVDLNLTGSNTPDYLAAGDNIHVVAKVGEFNQGQCLFFLDPVSTEVR